MPATIISPMAFRLGGRVPTDRNKTTSAAVENYQTALMASSKRAERFLRPVIIPKGKEILRNVDTRYSPGQIPPNASFSLENRWSGSIQLATGKIGRGALYVSQDLNAFLNEAMRYTRPPSGKRSIPYQGGKADYFAYGPAKRGFDEMLVGRVYSRFKLSQTIEVMDLAPSQAYSFFRAVESDPEYVAATKDLRAHGDLMTYAYDLFDYTASRPVGLSILLSQRGQGLRVKTAQREIDTTGDGFNLVLSGDDGKAVPYLQPTGSIIAGKTSDGQQSLIRIDEDGQKLKGEVPMVGSVIPIPTE